MPARQSGRTRPFVSTKLREPRLTLGIFRPVLGRAVEHFLLTKAGEDERGRMAALHRGPDDQLHLKPDTLFRI